MVWWTPDGGNYMQTPLVYGEEVYLLSDTGVLACLDLATGEQRYRERLGDGQTGFTASMVARRRQALRHERGGHGPRRQGRHELRGASRKNELGETCMATPAISDRACSTGRARSNLVAIRSESNTT